MEDADLKICLKSAGIYFFLHNCQLATAPLRPRSRNYHQVKQTKQKQLFTIQQTVIRLLSSAEQLLSLKLVFDKISPS